MPEIQIFRGRDGIWYVIEYHLEVWEVWELGKPVYPFPEY